MDDKTLYNLASQAGQALVANKQKLVTAESCTGGGVAYWLTAVPGSSEWFDRGFVTYSNQAKQSLLNIPAETIQLHGAVSEETVNLMAKGALEHSEADIAIAITGIAGPSGGSQDKPVGTVWFCWAGKTFSIAEHQVFVGDRAAIRKQAIEFALQRLLEINQ